MKIEEGKFYRTRDGRRVGPARLGEKPYVYGRIAYFLDSTPVWANNGLAHFDGSPEQPGDIVAEWVDDADAAATVEGAPIVEDNYFETHKADGSAAAPDIEDDGFVTVVPDVKSEIADEAKRIVSGARRAAYGKPEQNFERIARFWEAYFKNRGISLREADGTPYIISAADVSPMMRLMKEARLCETPDHRDSFVDLVGYALTGAEVNNVKSSA